MSTIERDGSAFEPSSAPWRTVPVACAAAAAGHVRVADLARVRDGEESELQRVEVPLAPTRMGPPPLPSTWLPAPSTSVPCGETPNWPLRV